MSGRSDLDVKLTLLHLYGVLVGPIIWIAILSVRCVKCTPPRFFASQMGVMPLILTYVTFIIRHCFKRTLNVCIYKYIFTQFQQKTGETKTISMREARQITQKKKMLRCGFHVDVVLSAALKLQFGIPGRTLDLTAGAAPSS